MSDFTTFRRDLDAVLARRDPAALRAFLVESGQWAEETTMDPAAALWMMIATSPALPHLHAEARDWLKTHGRAEDAAALDGDTDEDHPPRPRGPRRPPPNHGAPQRRPPPKRPKGDH